MAPENSLQNYKANLNSGNPSNNFNRPNLDYKNGGRLESTNYQTIKKSTNSVDWNKYSSSDPILNFNSTSTNIKGSGFINALGTIASVATPLMGIGMSVFAIANAAKAAKGVSSASSGNSTAPAADQNLSSLTNAANNYDKKSDYKSMLNTANNLKTAIFTANQKLNNAKRTSATAQNTITNLNKQRTNYDNQRTDFITTRDSIQTTLETNKDALSQLKNLPEDQRPADYDTLVANLEKKVSDDENKLKNEYSDAKLKTIEDQIERIDKDIDKWTTTKLEADIQVKQLPGEIKEAEKACDSLDKKIMKQAS